MPVETTMILILINQVLVTLTGPLMGQLVDRFGERAMLSASYLGLVFVFLGYAIVDHRPTLYVLYCIDNLIFIGGIALTTYIHRIAPEADLKPTLSMGVTMNHMAAVAAPLIGGLAWYYFSYTVIFFSGRFPGCLSMGQTRHLPPGTPGRRLNTKDHILTADSRPPFEAWRRMHPVDPLTGVEPLGALPWTRGRGSSPPPCCGSIVECFRSARRGRGLHSLPHPRRVCRFQPLTRAGPNPVPTG
jgi:MFS family permease